MKLRHALCLLVVLALVATGCASSGATSGGGAAEPPAPAKKAFVAPDWDSEAFSSEEHGFSVHYPADFSEAPATGGGLFSAASPSQVPRLDINVLPLAPTTGMDEVGASLEQAMAEVGGGEAKVTASKAVTLSDEVTEAMEFTLEWSFQGFPLQSLVLGAPSADGASIVSVMVTGMQGGDLAELANVAYTLYFD